MIRRIKQILWIIEQIIRNIKQLLGESDKNKLNFFTSNCMLFFIQKLLFFILFALSQDVRIRNQFAKTASCCNNQSANSLQPTVTVRFYNIASWTLPLLGFYKPEHWAAWSPCHFTTTLVSTFWSRMLKFNCRKMKF